MSPPSPGHRSLGPRAFRTGSASGLRPAFAQRRRGLRDFLLVLLCVWAAAYHTPLGALTRTVAARVSGVSTSARPLLAYYTGGVYGEGAAGGAVPAALPAFRAPPSPREALAWGVHAVVAGLPADARAQADAVAVRYGRGEGRWGERDVDVTRRALAGLLRELGEDGEEAAVAAFFYGPAVARFAAERVRAGGEEVVLAALRRHLPPGQEDALALTSRALMLGTAYGVRWPVAQRAPLNSRFGERVDPFTSARRRHDGVDLGLPVGTPVRAVAAGRVLRASEDAVSGRMVVLDHGRGVTSRYLHNSALKVRPGEVVTQGQVVALSGNTGRSSGAHLHYQLELSGEPVDPLRFHARADAPAGPKLRDVSARPKGRR